MLRKLMKHEFYATGRIFLPLFAALAVVGIINRLLMNLPSNTPMIVSTALSGILISGIVVVSIILTLQRFNKNLLSNEGYLMMTLPVSADSLILSKMFVSAIWLAASFAVVAGASVIMFMSDSVLPNISEILKFLSDMFMKNPVFYAGYAITLLVMIIMTMFSGILTLYACMSLGMLVNKRRWLMSVGAFIAINAAQQMIMKPINFFVANSSISNSEYSSMFAFNISANNISFQELGSLLFNLALTTAGCAALYLITRYMLKNRLNLQ